MLFIGVVCQCCFSVRFGGNPVHTDPIPEAPNTPSALFGVSAKRRVNTRNLSVSLPLGHTWTLGTSKVQEVSVSVCHWVTHGLWEHPRYYSTRVHIHKGASVSQNILLFTHLLSGLPEVRGRYPGGEKLDLHTG